MSVRPCPHCGSPFPPNTRFCGQCGHTFSAEGGTAPTEGAPRRVPITLDEATSDANAASPRVGIPTMIGRAAVIPSRATEVEAPKGPSGLATMIGHVSALGAAPKELGRTLYDPAPYGQTVGDDRERERAERAASSQRPTPLVPPPPADPRREPGDSNVVDEEHILPEGAVTRRVDAVSLEMPAPAVPGKSGATSMQDAPMAARPVPPPGSSKQTIFGMPAVNVPIAKAAAPPPAAVRAAEPAAPPAEVPPPAPPSSAARAFPPTYKTMMGVARPGIAPTHNSAAPDPPGLPHPAPHPPAPQPPAPMERAGTLVGLAAPGIAPSNAGHPAAAPSQGTAPLAPTPAPPPVVPAPAPLVEEPLPEPLQLQRRRGVPAIAVVAIVFALVALVGGGAALYVLKSNAPLSAQPQLDESGKESLKIRCESCPDGTVVTLGASSAHVQATSALLPLPAPLAIGDNDLELKIDRPAGGRDESVKLHVPVAYRAKVDLSTLGADPPTVTVRVEALPGTEVTVDGKPIALDATGKGSHPIDVSADVAGPSKAQKAIDRKIPFTIKSKQGATENGQLAVHAVVVPLQIDAPGVELYTDRANAAIAGLTKVGATLSVDGQTLALDATGRFGVRVELPAEGEKVLTIVAASSPLAPRTVRAKVVRVASLDAAAKTLDTKSPLGFDAFAADPPANVGKLVVVDGEIIQINATQGYSVMMVEDRSSCAAKTACVVRIVHGEEIKAAPGARIRAYGRLEGTVSAGGKAIPDVEGSLVIPLPSRAARR